VEDVAEAFACVLHKGVVGEVYNIGTQKERTVLDVAQDIAKVFKLPTEKIVHVRDRAFNDRLAQIGLDFDLCCNSCLCEGLWPSNYSNSHFACLNRYILIAGT